MLNEMQIKAVAKALGIPEIDDDFVVAYAEKNGFVGYGGVELDSIVSYLMQTWRCWSDVAEEAAEALTSNLEWELSEETRLMNRFLKFFQNAANTNEMAHWASELASAAKKVRDLDIRIKNICADYPNADWIKKHE